jgi:pentatricopeptide repeat domain-containing protein 1
MAALGGLQCLQQQPSKTRGCGKPPVHTSSSTLLAHAGIRRGLWTNKSISGALSSQIASRYECWMQESGFPPRVRCDALSSAEGRQQNQEQKREDDDAMRSSQVMKMKQRRRTNSSTDKSVGREVPVLERSLLPSGTRKPSTAPRSQYRKGNSKSEVDPVVVAVTRKLLGGMSVDCAVKELMVELDGAMCRKILTYLDMQDAPDMAIDVVKYTTMKESQGSKSVEWKNSDEATVLWTKLMKMHMRRRDGGASRALEIYDAMCNHQIAFDVVSFNTALASASTCGKWKKVQEIRAEMKKRNISEDAFTYSSLLGGCKTNGKWRQARKWFAEMEELEGITPNVFHYTTLMTTLQRAGAWKESVEVFNKMERSGVKADVVSYNAAITACAKGEDWQQAWSIFSAMRRDGIEPSVVSYNALLSACERCGQADRAVEVFENMSRRGIACNQVTYNTLISACGKAGKFDVALAINEQMKEQGVREDVFTLTGLISGCSTAGDWRRALALVQQFRTMGVKPNVVVYNQLISTLGGHPHEWRRALAAWEDMKNEGIVPDVVTYGALISTLEKAGKWREALDLYEELLEESPSIEPNMYIYSSVLNACERGRQWDRATELFQALMVLARKESKHGNQDLNGYINMNSISILARKAMYSSPGGSVLSAMPDPLVTTAKTVVDSGRAAREMLFARNRKEKRTTTDDQSES